MTTPMNTGTPGIPLKFARGHAPNISLNSLSEIAFIDNHIVDKPNNEEELVPYVGLPECSQTEIQEIRAEAEAEWAAAKERFEKSLLE